MASDESNKATTGRSLSSLWKALRSGAAAVTKTLGNRLSGLVSVRGLVLAAAALLLLQMLGLLRLPFPPFTTTGKIYVDSPEVYTRERLVNDRYDQDFWLRQRLQQLEDPGGLQLVVGSERTLVGGGTGEAAAAASNDGTRPADGPASAGGRRRLSFEQEFRVASGIRDMIRQQILENMLDDRHDLTGNSVYGLKFDTTVIPGENTRRRAFVHVTLKIDELFRIEDEAAESPAPARFSLADRPGSSLDSGDRKPHGFEALARSGLGAHIAGWAATRELDCTAEGERHSERAKRYIERYQKQDSSYLDWLNDVQRRLNDAEDSVYKSLTAGCTTKSERRFYDELTAKTMDVVLGIPEEVFFRLNPLPSNERNRAPGGYHPLLGAMLRLRSDLWRTTLASYPEIAIGIPPEALSLPDPSDAALPEGVKLPDPWAKFFSISRKPFVLPERAMAGTCHRQRVWFDVNELIEEFIFVDSRHEATDPGATEKESSPVAPEPGHVRPEHDQDSLDSGAPIEAPQEEEGTDDLELIPIAGLGDGQWMIMVTPQEYDWRANLFESGEGIGPKYDLTARFVSKVVAFEKELCELRRSRGLDCPQEGSTRTRVELKSGLFNFVERMSERDAYSYAIFPKNDVVGIFSETAAELSARVPTTGFLDIARRLTETKAASVLTGYGFGRGEGRSIEFGWVISDRGDLGPIQKSQLALVSVPAWTEHLDLRVSVGWLKRDGSPRIDPEGSFDLKIAVPTDYEVFDSIFREDVQVSLGPTIQDNEMDKEIYVRAGRETKILIPGSRLWRSASVTLGAQLAERIRVMPNMQGIIAEFGHVDVPYAAYKAESGDADLESVPSSGSCSIRDVGKEGSSRESRPAAPLEQSGHQDLRVRAVRLRVWTSEGVVSANEPVCVVYDHNEVLRSARTDGASSDSGER